MNIEEIGRLADSLDCALSALLLPLPPHIHINGLSEVLRGVRDMLRDHYREQTGTDPWEHHPDHDEADAVSGDQTQ